MYFADISLIGHIGTNIVFLARILADIGKNSYFCTCGKMDGAYLVGKPRVKGFLLDTCLTAQDNFKALLDYFKIKYRP